MSSLDCSLAPLLLLPVEARYHEVLSGEVVLSGDSWAVVRRESVRCREAGGKVGVTAAEEAGSRKSPQNNPQVVTKGRHMMMPGRMYGKLAVLFLVMLAVAMVAPMPAMAAITIDSSGATVFQQTTNNPCVIGDPSCNQPANFDFY